jgi:hypothetical protein
VVLSGFVVRYLSQQVSEEVREKKNLQAALFQRYRETATEIGRRPELAAAFAAVSRPMQWLRSYLLVPLYGVTAASADPYVRAVDLAESIADLDYAIRTHEVLKIWFTRWLRVHIWLSVILYVLLALHVWGAVHFGIRWFGD